MIQKFLKRLSLPPLSFKIVKPCYQSIPCLLFLTTGLVHCAKHPVAKTIAVNDTLNKSTATPSLSGNRLARPSLGLSTVGKYKQRYTTGVNHLINYTSTGSQNEYTQDASGNNFFTTPAKPLSCASSLPTQIDNSTSVAFPPIGDQGSQASSVAFASTYYQLSYEYCRQSSNCDNKNQQQAIFSPAWTYNLLNGGQDLGLGMTDPFILLATHGALLWSEFPYQSTDNGLSVLKWPQNSQSWMTALSRRTTQESWISTANGQTSLSQIKCALSSGHVLYSVLSSSCFENLSPQQVTVQNQEGITKQTRSIIINPSFSPDLAQVIVGYDDTATYLDAQNISHTGMLKLANSWGTSWADSGFYWVPYDLVFNLTNNQSFIGLFANSEVAYFDLYEPNYQPQWIANAIITSKYRYNFNFNIQTPNSPPTTLLNDPFFYFSKTPVSPLMCPANFADLNSCPPLPIDGTSNSLLQTTSIALDATSFISLAPEYASFNSIFGTYPIFSTGGSAASADTPNYQLEQMTITNSTGTIFYLYDHHSPSYVINGLTAVLAKTTGNLPSLVDPTPSFTAQLISPTTANSFSVTFDATGNIPPLATIDNYEFFWRFGDGNTSVNYGLAGAVVTNNYALASNFNVFLTIKDPQGNLASTQKLVSNIHPNSPPMLLSPNIGLTMSAQGNPSSSSLLMIDACNLISQVPKNPQNQAQFVSLMVEIVKTGAQDPTQPNQITTWIDTNQTTILSGCNGSLGQAGTNPFTGQPYDLSLMSSVRVTAQDPSGTSQTFEFTLKE
jgi:C1A family cysteine protease